VCSIVRKGRCTGVRTKNGKRREQRGVENRGGKLVSKSLQQISEGKHGGQKKTSPDPRSRKSHEYNELLFQRRSSVAGTRAEKRGANAWWEKKVAKPRSWKEAQGNIEPATKSIVIKRCQQAEREEGKKTTRNSAIGPAR